MTSRAEWKRRLSKLTDQQLRDSMVSAILKTSTMDAIAAELERRSKERGELVP